MIYDISYDFYPSILLNQQFILIQECLVKAKLPQEKSRFSLPAGCYLKSQKEFVFIQSTYFVVSCSHSSVCLYFVVITSLSHQFETISVTLLRPG